MPFVLPAFTGRSGQSSWTDERVAILRKMFAAGDLDKTIADALRVSAPTVRVKRRHLGLVRARGAPAKVKAAPVRPMPSLPIAQSSFIKPLTREQLTAGR